MAVPRDSVSDASRRTLAAVVFTVMVAALILPRWTVGLLPFLVLAWGLILRPPLDWRAVLLDDAVKWALVLFLAYLAANASWSLDPADAYYRVSCLALFLMLVFVAVYWAEHAGPRVVGVLSAALGTGALAGAVVLAAEVAGERALSSMLFDLAPALRPGTERQMFSLDELNRNVGLLALLFWPVVLCLRRLKDARGRLLATPLFLAATAVAVGLSAHASSSIALIAGAVAFLAMQRLPRFARRAVTALWCAAFLLVVPASLASYQAGLHTAHWLPTTGQARIILWSQTAAKTADRPILGIGVRSTKTYDARNRERADRPPDHVYPLHTGRHAHNIYLQSWFELGLVGVASMLAIGLLLLARLARLPPQVQRYAYAQFVTFMAIGGTTWGVWQSWYLAGIALAAVAMAIAVARARQVA